MGADVYVKRRIGEGLSVNDALKILNFPVHAEAVYRKAGEEIDNTKAIIRTDTNNVLGIMSNRYRILPNKEVFLKPMTHLNIKEGYEVSRLFLKNGGTKSYVEMLSKDDYSVSDTDSKEVYKKRLVLENSFDGSSSLNFLFGSWRKICNNGAGVWVGKVDRIRMVHMGDQEVGKQIIKCLENFEKAWGNYLTNITQLYNSEVRQQSYQAIFTLLEIGKRMQLDLIRRMKIQKQTNFLAIYNAITEYYRDQESKKNYINPVFIKNTNIIMQKLVQMSRDGI